MIDSSDYFWYVVNLKNETWSEVCSACIFTGLLLMVCCQGDKVLERIWGKRLQNMVFDLHINDGE